jgi:hypothetical protein
MAHFPLKILEFPQTSELVGDCLLLRLCLLEVVPFLDHLDFGTRALFVLDGKVAHMLRRAGFDGGKVPSVCHELWVYNLGA